LKVAYLPISIKILPNIGLMYARFEGHITVPDATAAFQAYMDWSASAHIVVRVLETEQSALDVLGLPYNSFAQMLDEGETAGSSVLTS